MIFQMNFEAISFKSYVTNEGWRWFWVKVTKPVSYVIKGVRLREFKDPQHNPLTKRVSLPLPSD